MKANTIIFFAKHSELEGRLDPEFIKYNRITQAFKFPTVKLRNLLKARPQYGANEPGIPRTSKDSIRYIRITDIDENGILNNEDGATSLNIEDKYILHDNDLLIARSGNTVGKSYLHKLSNVSYPCFFAGYMIRFVLDESLVVPDYVFIITQLRYYKTWVQAIQRSAGQPNINAEEYKSLKIALPPINIQQQLVRKLENAYASKTAKEAKAKELINSIDGFILKELGAKAGIKKTKTEALFRKHHSDITGIRWDPLYHSGNIYNFIESSSFELNPLWQCATYLCSGFAAGKTDQSKESTDIIQIRPTNINDERRLIFDRNVYILREELKTRNQDVLIPGEVLFNNTNSQELVGKSVVFDMSQDYFCSNHITRIGVDSKKILPEYLSAILNLYQRQGVFYKICTNWNNQSGVGREVLRTVPIPVPSLKIQLKIKNQIIEVYFEADQLRTEARMELEQAKKDVEEMILGGKLQ